MPSPLKIRAGKWAQFVQRKIQLGVVAGGPRPACARRGADATEANRGDATYGTTALAAIASTAADVTACAGISIAIAGPG